MDTKVMPDRIDFETPSDEAICLHEAGHACAALIVGLQPELIEFVEQQGAPGRARNRIPVGDERQRRLVACAGYAVEYNLFKANRLTNAAGSPLHEKTFIQLAIGQNAAIDKQQFFGDSREQSNGSWPAADDTNFMTMGAEVAKLIPMDCVEALAAALLAERRLGRERIIEVTRPYITTDKVGEVSP